MNDEYDYTLDDLLEQAQDDPSWEPDAAKRAEMIGALRGSLMML